MDNQEGLPAVPKSPTLPDDQTPNRWPTATPPSPEMSWNSASGGRFSDFDESSVEEIVDLTLPTPSPKKKKLITEFFKPGGASTTNKNSALGCRLRVQAPGHGSFSPVVTFKLCS